MRFRTKRLKPTVAPRYFVQRIAEHGSFLEAAEHLGRSQANLSIKVAALEKHLGYAMFQRSDHGITLTRKGEELLRLVTPFLHDLHEFTRAGACARMVSAPSES